MNRSNPYEPPSTQTNSGRRRLIDFLIAGIWLVIPLAVFVGRRMLDPVFIEFDVELPTATLYLLHPYSLVPFAITSFLMVLAIFGLPYGSTRRRFIWFACITGMLMVVVCLFLLLVPLLSLWRNLM